MGPVGVRQAHPAAQPLAVVQVRPLLRGCVAGVRGRPDPRPDGGNDSSGVRVSDTTVAPGRRHLFSPPPKQGQPPKKKAKVSPPPQQPLMGRQPLAPVALWPPPATFPPPPILPPQGCRMSCCLRRRGLLYGVLGILAGAVYSPE